ncbi:MULTISPECIES: hypothetical protein [unclassified Microcoleus]|uniref:hypothetical protein n=1 Tax=unclassified Microcoleus TaxID=2642155 RepID=UPI001DD3A9A5|nr:MULTISPECIES: hypothetical protein [unclassified Microcoleus]MCC3467247.1 hypothetical protein [Microcoleus sp. PH2017_06_SFM_O_A]MCC3413486.1 hypothetical protein [Microcoleus sp. PH2017_02_FOX_O_A]MCC3424408.1 hypothetical protein [Microcoleus sp. PH2017_01_SCD_O_A]MCC3447619.1 hypothetical protein [Microcoleus sp. PH2017_09_SFU_O_A]MCC3517406.1 hypothetical protein [Microcoleus sp. PH2017_18_LLB_O_A]
MEEGRRKKEEGRRKREEGRGKKEEGRRKRGREGESVISDYQLPFPQLPFPQLPITNYQLPITPN